MKNKIFLFIIGICFITHASAQTLLIDDPLTDGKSVGEICHVYAGDPAPKFTAEGWQPGATGDNQNHILYQVPVYFKNGYIEFEIKGMENPTIDTYDPAFCALYDGRGVPEFCRYFDDFKNNYFRWNVQYRGDNKCFKGKIQMAKNTEEQELRNSAVFKVYDATEYSCMSERDGSSVSWNKTTWYKIKVEWKDRKYSVTVDGTSKWSTSQGCDFTPRNFKIWLGSAPGYTGKYTASVPGLTYRNFKLYTYDVLEANVSCDSINFPAAGFLSFRSVIQDDLVTKNISVQNLKNIPITVSLSSSNANYTLSETSLTLQANEKKSVLVTMNTSAVGSVRGVITVACNNWVSSRTITCVGTVISNMNVVDEYEDQFNDNTLSGMFTPELNNSFFKFSEADGSMLIKVNKNKTDTMRKGFVFNTIKPSPFYINMSKYPYIAVNVKVTKEILLTISPNNFDQPSNESNVTNQLIVKADGLYHLLSLNFAQQFANSITPANLINRVWFSVNHASLITSDVSFDYILIGKKALVAMSQKEVMEKGYKLYPNPAISSINVSCDNEVSEIQITDLSGRILLREKPSENITSIDVSSLIGGIYIVIVISNNKAISSEKLIIQ